MTEYETIQQVDPYWETLLTIVSMYKGETIITHDNKQIYFDNRPLTRKLIETSLVVVSILNAVYYYLVGRKEIDPIDSRNKKEIAFYLINTV